MSDPLFPGTGGYLWGTSKPLAACCPISGEMLWAVVYDMGWSSPNAQDHDAVILYKDNATSYLPTWVITYDHALVGAAGVANNLSLETGWGDAARQVYGNHSACFFSFATWCDGHHTLTAFVGNSAIDHASNYRNKIYTRSWVLNSRPTPGISNGQRIDEIPKETTNGDYSCGRAAAVSRVGVEERRYLFFLGHDGHRLSFIDPELYASIRPDVPSDRYGARLFMCWSDSPEYLGKEINVVPLSNLLSVGPFQFQMASRHIAGCVDDRGFYHAVATVRSSNDQLWKVWYVRPTAVTAWVDSSVYTTTSKSNDLTSPCICFDRYSKTLLIAWGVFLTRQISVITSTDYGVTWGVRKDLAMPMNPESVVPPNLSMTATFDSGAIMLTVSNAIREGEVGTSAIWSRLGTAKGALWGDWIAATDNSDYAGVGDDYPWGGQTEIAGGRGNTFAVGLPAYRNGRTPYASFASAAKWTSGNRALPPSNTYSNSGVGNWMHFYTATLPTANGRDIGTISQYGTDLLVTATGRILVSEQNAYSVTGSANDYSHFVHYSDNSGVSWATVDIWAYTTSAPNGFGHGAANAGCSFPFLARFGSTIYYVANTKNDETSTTDRICVQKSTDDGATWAARVTDVTMNLRIVAGAASTHGIFVVGNYFYGSGEYFIGHSSNEGTSWSLTATGVEYDSVGDCLGQSVAIDDTGKAHIVVYGVRISDGKYCCAYFRPATASSWNSPVFVYESDYPLSLCLGAQVVVRGGNVYIFFLVGKETVSQWMTYSTTYGTSLSTPSKVFTRAKDFPYEYNRLAQVCITSGNKLHMVIAASWRLDVPFTGTFVGDYYISSTNNGTKWTPLQEVVNDGTYTLMTISGSYNWQFFKIVSDGDSFHMVTYADDDGVMYARRS